MANATKAQIVIVLEMLLESEAQVTELLRETRKSGSLDSEQQIALIELESIANVVRRVLATGSHLPEVDADPAFKAGERRLHSLNAYRADLRRPPPGGDNTQIDLEEFLGGSGR